MVFTTYCCLKGCLTVEVTPFVDNDILLFCFSMKILFHFLTDKLTVYLKFPITLVRGVAGMADSFE